MKTLLTKLRATPTEQEKIDEYHQERLAHIASWSPLHFLDWPADEIKRFRNAKSSLKGILLLDFERQYGKVLDFDVQKASTTELLRGVSAKSAKLRYVCLLVAVIIYILKTKVKIWVQYPWAQLIVEKFLAAAGVKVDALHANLSGQERGDVIRMFTEAHDDCHVLVCSYKSRRCMACHSNVHL
ncbi:MAG: hypothetical protein M1816_001007 [Peltula sp. TS41687]|nr:MAG: hypothetical protein M1816_001007 [Peltula sp. TS41687]